MRALKVLLVTLFISINLSGLPVCEAQYLEILKGVGTVVQFALKAREQLKPFLDKQNQALDEHAIQNQKLNKITEKIESLEKEMMKNFEKLIKDLDKIPGETVTQNTASKFERYMQSINTSLGYLVSKKEKVNRGELSLDDHFRHDVSDYKTQLDKTKLKLEVIMQGKGLSVDFLEQVKKKASVCTDKMTQTQLLDSFRALYVDTVSRYLMAEHIVISLWESADKTSHKDKKRELNSVVREDLLKYSRRFQELMRAASREFQLCGKPTSEYTLHDAGESSRECYQTGEGELSNKIVEFGQHFTGNKHCWDYLSLRPATARPGYVVVGAKIERNVNILYVRIIEGKLLPSGIIDPTSITYNEATQSGIGEQVVRLDYRQTIVDITKTIATGDRVITGLRFAQTDDKRIYLEVQSTQLDLDKGILIRNTARTEPHQKGSTQFQVRPHDSRNDPIIKNAIGLQTVKENQYVKFVIGGKLQAHPFIDMSEVFSTPLTLLSGASLYVREVEGTQGYLSIRLFTFDIAPHVTKIDFELNDDFADVLKAI